MADVSNGRPVEYASGDHLDHVHYGAVQTITAPQTVPLSKVKAFLADLGIDATHLVHFECGVDGVYVETWALNEDGKPYFASAAGSEPAMHRISMQLDRDA